MSTPISVKRRMHTLAATAVLTLMLFLPACGGGGSGGGGGVDGGGGVQTIIATGVLDADFDADGIRLFDFMMDNDRGNDVAIQPDGKIVVAGTVDNAGTSELAVVRFNGDGSLDTTFDGDGIASTSAGGGPSGNAIALQADGKIVVAGNSLGGTSFILVRFNPDGSLDSTFDADGIASTNLAGQARANGVAIQSDGKIVAVGSIGGPSSVSFDTAVVRYNADGSEDTTFDVDGVVTTNVSPGNFDAAQSVAIQLDDKIVTVGAAGGEVSVLRYNGDGSLDAGFDTDGIVTTSVTGNSDSGSGVALQPDGKILVCGVGAGSGGNTDVGVIRYNPDGSLDLSFNGNGIVITNVAGVDRGNAVALQSNGQIIVAADVGGEFGVLRYNADGSLDPGFDGDGIVTTLVGAGSNSVNGLAIQPDGRIVVVGTAQDPGNVSLDIAVVRYE